MYQVNEEGTRNVLAACKEAGIKEYFDLIVHVAGRGKSPLIKLPKWAAVISGYGYELPAWITLKPPITSASWVRVGSRYSWWGG
jgi:hypothetical protein